jgi:dihydroorotase
MNGGMKDLCNVMSKFLNMGMPLPQVIDRVTRQPAQVIARTELGQLNTGGVADITVFRVEQGDYGFMDVRKTRIKGSRRIVAELTLRAGKIVWDLNGLSAPLWQSELPRKN